MVVVLELGEGEQIVPIVLPLIYEEVQILFELLVNPFCLSFGLGVIGCCGCKLNPEEPVQFPCELSNELWAPVGNDLSWEPMEFPIVG